MHTIELHGASGTQLHDKPWGTCTHLKFLMYIAFRICNAGRAKKAASGAKDFPGRMHEGARGLWSLGCASTPSCPLRNPKPSNETIRPLVEVGWGVAEG